LRGFDYFCRSALGAGDISGMSMGILGDLVILAVFAVEIAAYCGNGIRKGTRQQMKERFFLDGVDIFADQTTIVEAVEDPASIFPDLADSPMALTDQAIVVAEQATDRARGISCFGIKKRFVHGHPLKAIDLLLSLGLCTLEK